MTLAYGTRVVLADVGFHVPAGALTAILGPNGSGKTTLLRALAGLVRPLGGRLRVLGDDPRCVRARIRYVAQRPDVDGDLPVTCTDVVVMGRWAGRGPWGRLRGTDREAVASVMERLGIRHLARRRLGELSGGQRQRVLLAQGLVQPGDLLLLDEPTAGLDAPTRDLLRDVLTEECGAGRTVVLVTHDAAEAARSAYVLLVGGGRLSAGPPEVVLRPELLAAAYGVPEGASTGGW